MGSFGEGGGVCATLSYKSPHGLGRPLPKSRYRRGARPLSAASSFTARLRPPPNIHSIFDLLLVPQSPPTINTIDTKSTPASPLSSPFPTRPRTMHGVMCTYGTSLLAGSLILRRFEIDFRRFHETNLFIKSISFYIKITQDIFFSVDLARFLSS